MFRIVGVRISCITVVASSIANQNNKEKQEARKTQLIF